jgi:hypothetical protein
MHYGRGWRLAGMIKYELSSGIDAWIRLAQSIYPGEESIGSGLNAIELPHRTELKMQLKISF